MMSCTRSSTAVPALLSAVHALIEEGHDWRFVLTGSSARKLRRSGVDLMAGRAVVRTVHPFMTAELGDVFDLRGALERGMLPLVLQHLSIRREARAIDPHPRLLDDVPLANRSGCSPGRRATAACVRPGCPIPGRGCAVAKTTPWHGLAVSRIVPSRIVLVVDQPGRPYLSRSGKAGHESPADRTARSRSAAGSGLAAGSVGGGRGRRRTLPGRGGAR